MIFDNFERLKEYSKQLETIPFVTVYKIIRDLKIKNLPIITINSGTFIMRSRISEGSEFSSINQISYNKKPKHIGRANIINSTIFYGSFTLEPTKEKLFPLFTNYLEVLEILRKKVKPENIHEFQITVGQWKVINDMPVVSMVFNETYVTKNKSLRNLYEFSYNSVNQKDREVLSFISNQFAKEIVNSDSDYKISAAFSENLFSNYDMKYGALIYPSVRTDGEGLNIAIKPRYLKKYIELDRVFTLKIYIKKSCIFIDWQKHAAVDISSGTFDLEPIMENGANIGRESALLLLEKMIESADTP